MWDVTKGVLMIGAKLNGLLVAQGLLLRQLILFAKPWSSNRMLERPFSSMPNICLFVCLLVGWLVCCGGEGGGGGGPAEGGDILGGPLQRLMKLVRKSCPGGALKGAAGSATGVGGLLLGLGVDDAFWEGCGCLQKL